MALQGGSHPLQLPPRMAHPDHPDVGRVWHPGHGRGQPRRVGGRDHQDTAVLLVEPHPAVSVRVPALQPVRQARRDPLQLQAADRLGGRDVVGTDQVSHRLVPAARDDGRRPGLGRRRGREKAR